MNNTSKKRFDYLDTAKFIAIMWIFVVHYISEFQPQWFAYWDILPFSLLLKGLTGKCALAMLAVTMGFLAYYKGTKQGGLFAAVVKRYLSFFVMGLFVNVIYAANSGLSLSDLSVLKDILVTSLAIGDGIYATFWCMQSFFIASVVSYIAGLFKLKELPVCGLVALFIVLGEIWVAVCLMGNLLYVMTDAQDPRAYRKVLENRWVQLLLVVAVFFAVKRSESDVTYVIDGLCAALMLAVISMNSKAEKLFSAPALVFMGKYSMGIFLLHPLVYTRLGGVILSCTAASPLMLLLTFLLCVVVTVLLSFPLVKAINWCSAAAFRLLVAAKERTTALLPRS